METFQKALEEIKATSTSPQMVNSQMATNPEYSYRDALLNNQHPTHLPPMNVHEARLQNRLNIDARQILIEIQSEAISPIGDEDPTNSNSTGKIKIAANHWLANRDGDNPPPPNTIIRAITQCRNKKLLIKANTSTAAEWIKLNATRIFNPLIGHPVKTIGRQYPVIARFVPILFRANEGGTRELESNANLQRMQSTRSRGSRTRNEGLKDNELLT
jgi:hypothetical protein